MSAMREHGESGAGFLFFWSLRSRIERLDGNVNEEMERDRGRNMESEGEDCSGKSVQVHSGDVAGGLELCCGGILGMQDFVDGLANSGEKIRTEEVAEDGVFVVPEILVFSLHEGLFVTVDLRDKEKEIGDGAALGQVGELVCALWS